MNQKYPSRKGFTLIEVIVVAVIIAILAAISIPLYTGYIASTRKDAVNNLAQTGAAAANIFYRKTGSDPQPSDLNLTYDATQYTVSVNAPSVAVSTQNITPAVAATVSYR